LEHRVSLIESKSKHIHSLIVRLPGNGYRAGHFLHGEPGAHALKLVWTVDVSEYVSGEDH